MKSFPKYLATELKLRFRIPISVFFIFIFPIFLMVAFASSFGRNNPHYMANNIATIMFYAVLSASVVSFSNDISRYKQDNFYFLLERRGGNKLAYLFAQIVGFVIIIFLSTLAILAIAHSHYNYTLPDISTLLVFYVKLYAYTLPFFLIAIIIGLSVKNASVASAIGMPVMFISYFLAGMMIPYSELAGGIKTIAHNFFLTQLLSDLTHTLTSTYVVKPNWMTISISISIITVVAAIVLYRSSLMH